jgi:hypothetical protein
MGYQGKKEKMKKWGGWAFQKLEHIPERAFHFLNPPPKHEGKK